MTLKTAAKALASRLLDMGTKHFFLLTGGDQPLWIALEDVGIEMILCRSEASAVYMADGYSRASGQPGVVYGQAGPGAANVAAALADPYWAKSSVVAITGATATTAVGRLEYQDLDQMTLFQPVTKWSAYAARASTVPGLVATAVMQSQIGTPGPTHVDIPKDFFGEEVEVPKLDRRLEVPTDNASGGSLVSEAAEIIRSAKRPIVLAGSGVLRSSSHEELRRLAESAVLPVATTIGGKGSLPALHPLSLGVAGRYASKLANAALAESDCVLVLGSQLGGLSTNGYTLPSTSAAIIHVDSAPDKFNLNYHSALNVRANISSFLSSLRIELHSRPSPTVHQDWQQDVRRRISDWRHTYAQLAIEQAHKKPISPLALMSTLSRYCKHIAVVADTGYMAAWTAVLFDTDRPHSYYRAVGSLGWALPATLGVQLARSEKTVCVTGDGGIGYHIADLETAVRLKLPVIVVVLNNGSLAFEYHEQKYRHGGRVVSQANDFRDFKFADVARAAGADGFRVDSLDEFEKVFRAAIESDVPTLIDVIIDKEAVPPVSNYDGFLDRAL